jgi:hypothetical protein
VTILLKYPSVKSPLVELKHLGKCGEGVRVGNLN